ncbi:MAG TPA: YihY/virulence factor BrkB family protein [Gemmataceae bacterium]|nr:YihY/virulence factor BrkB family protein [Gemmataceae bacterium]
MPVLTSVRILWRACQQWSVNQDSRLGAALAYYTLFSIAPLLVIAIRIAGLFFGEDAARGKVVEQLKEIFGPESASAIQNLIENAAQAKSEGWETLLTFGVLIIGSLSVFLHVRGALCTIWKLEPPRGNTILGILLNYFLALVMVVCTGVLLLLSLAASVIIPIFQDWMNQEFPENGFSWQVLEFCTSVLFLTLLFTAMFRILSGQRIEWKYVVYGSLITSLLFSVGKVALGMYLVYSRTASMYGAAGSLVVFLIWVYYSSQILFFGAELVQARRTRHEWMKPE